MALTPIVEGATSAANDLNQIVNLLNGTDTATPVTVNGPIAAQMAGMAAPLRYVGGVGPRPPIPLYGALTFGSDPPQLTSFDAGASGSAGSYYQNGDLSWQTAGGPLTVYNGFLPFLGLPGGGSSNSNPIGTAGYACRVHQAGAYTVATTGNNYVTGDTVDFDPRGMVKPSFLANGGIAITLPFLAVWGIAGAIHSSGVNAMNVSWGLSPYTGFGSTSTLFGLQVSAASDNTHKYTGTSFFAMGTFGPDVQLAFTPNSFTAPASFNLDVSAPDRTYLAVWMIA